MNPASREIVIRDLKISLKVFNESAPIKVLALHGWLDNAGSFDVLAPLLQSCCVVAVDLPGQGFSDQRPLTADYHLWNDVVDVRLLADALGWEQFVLLGHSRGAMLSIMLAGAYPERVQQLFLVDGVMPLPVEIDKAAEQLRAYADAMAAEPREKRYYPDKGEAIKVRARAGAIPEALAEILAKRNLHKAEQGWFWAVDDRLKGASAVKMTDEHNRVFLTSVQCPVTVFLAEQGFMKHPSVERWQQLCSHFDWQHFASHHHLHMEEAFAQQIAVQIEAKIVELL